MGLHLSGSTVTQLNSAYAGLDTLAPIVRPVRPLYTLISTFQSGHGWTDLGGTAGGTAVDDTSVFEVGSQSIKVTTPAIAAANRAIRSPTVAAADLRAKNFVLLVRVDATTSLGDIRLIVAADNTFTDSTTYTAVYGNSNEDVGTLRANEWQWVHFTRAEQLSSTGTGGLDSVTIWQIRVDGGAGSVINAWFGAVGYYTPNTVFPNGVVSFACDDSYASQYDRLRPALDKYGYAATALPIFDLLDTSGRLTTAQLNELHDYHGWEIGAHALTAAHHNSTNGFQDLGEADLETEFKGMRALTARYGWRGGDVLAYPKGKDNALVRKVAAKYFAAARLVTRQPWQTVRADGRALRLRSYSVDSASTAASALTALIDSAYTNGWWLIITFHDITASGATQPTEWDVSKVQTVVDYCATKGIPVKTMGEVLTAQDPLPSTVETEAFLPAQIFGTSGGSPSLTTTLSAAGQRLYGFDLDAASAESIVTTAKPLPAHWNTFDIKVIWANAGAGSGAVVWSPQYYNVGTGATLGALETAGANVTATAGAQNVVVETTVLKNLARGSGPFRLELQRVAADAADTLANDATVIGVRLVKAT